MSIKSFFMIMLLSILTFSLTKNYAQGIKIIVSPAYQAVNFGSHEDDSYLRTHVHTHSVNEVSYSEINYYPVVYILQLAGTITYFYGSIPADAYPSLPIYYPVRDYYPGVQPTVVVGTPSIGSLWVRPLQTLPQGNIFIH